MSSDNRPRNKDKSKAKKKQKEIKSSKNVETKKVKTISEKYFNENVEVENTLKLRHELAEDDYAKQKQMEIDFFCNPFSTIKYEIKGHDGIAVEEEDNDTVEREDEVSQKSEAHSERSNDSPTHLASTYIGLENEPVVKKFDLERIEYNDFELLFRPSSRVILESPNDGEKSLVLQKDEGMFTAEGPRIYNESNKRLLIDRLLTSGNTEFFDQSGGLKNFEKLHDDDVYRLVSDKTFTPIYVPAMPMSFDFSSKLLNEKMFLKIYVSQISFDQHRLFSNEHHIAKLVEKLYAEYDRRKSNDVVGTIKSKLTSLRELKAQNFPSSPDDQKSARTIRNEEITLNLQIKNVRQKLHVEEKYDRMVLKSLLESWKNYKTVCSQQTYSFTNIVMKIQKFDVVSSKRAEWQKKYDIELNEMIAEEFDEYHVLKQKYKEFVRSAKDPDSIADEKDLVKKPRKPDIDKIVAELNEIYDEIPFDEPEVNVVLSKHNEESDKVLLKVKEKTRKFKKYSYRVELEIDDEIVGSTKHCKLDEDFTISVQSAFILKLTKQLPEKIKLLIFETKASSRKLAEIIVPIPDDEEDFVDANDVKFSFTSKRRRNSQSKLSSFRRSGRRKSINVSGEVLIKMGWTHEEGERSNDVTFVRKSHVESKELVSQDVLKKWFDSNLLDPLDPDAANLVKFVKEKFQTDLKASTHQSSQTNPNTFRFNEEKLSFCSEEELNSIERLHVLKARYNKDLSYRNRKLIPQSDRELEFDQDKETNIIDESSIADPIELQRFRGKKYLKKVYETITNHCEIINRDKMNTNILIGDEAPTLGSLSLAFLEIFGPKRPLKPIRRATSSRASCKIDDVTNFNIVVMAVRATNVPVRSEEPTQISSRKSSSTIAATSTKFTPFRSFSTHPHVFVAISLKDHHKTCRTSSAESCGGTTMWNEQMTIPYNLKTDSGKKVLSIDLYDEVVEDLIDNMTEVYQRITSKWLGSIKIPIANIFANQRIEGTFEVTIPQILLGYSKPKISPAENSMNENLPHMSKKTHINLFINLEPIAEVPRLISSGLECIEVESVELQIKVWFEQLKIEFPSRSSKWCPLVTLLTGKRACITRFVHPLKFPFEKNSETTECLIRRFVSLIPIQIDASASSSSCTGLKGVWLSNTHVLGLMTSSPKDLGVLLTCFYLELDYASWLILGSSITSGECCFVLTRESSEFFITDPTSGKKYNSMDVQCPLTSCFCLVNQYNVWANVQRESRIFMTQFDVNRSFDWRPLFQRVVDIPNETIHDMNFRFERSFDSRDLQKTIQAKIIKKISSWRSHRKTIWNRFVSENLKQILVKLEDDVVFENEADDHVEMLKSLYVNYKITGYTIDTKYTNLSSIVCDVKNTGIHLNLDSKVEFASSVFVKEYANNVISVWIFLVSLIPKM